MSETIDPSEAAKVADVIPLGDRLAHVVPGGYCDLDPADEGPSNEWVAVDTANQGPRHQCPCWPSSVAKRDGEHVGLIVVHHAFDGRHTGTPA